MNCLQVHKLNIDQCTFFYRCVPLCFTGGCYVQCLVTGASSGIGRATCQVLTHHGALVIGTGRNVAALKNLKENGHVADFIAADLTEPHTCKTVVDRAASILDGLTSVVNAAGVLRGGAMGDDNVTLENYEFNMKTNAQVPFEIMVHSIPYLKKAPKEQCPSIVNVSSVNGKQSFAACATYCMSKAALDQLTRCASIDLAGEGIRVNAVNPGKLELYVLHKLTSCRSAVR